MYGKSPVEFPRRIVCLSTEHVEICYALGAGDRVVGVPGTARRPAEAAAKPRVGGFTTFRVDRILELQPPDRRRGWRHELHAPTFRARRWTTSTAAFRASTINSRTKAAA